MNREKLLRRLAKPMLLATAILWGMSFMMMKTSTDSIPPMFLGAFRFTGGAAVVALLFIRHWKKCTFDYIWRGAVIGFVLFLAGGVGVGAQGETSVEVAQHGGYCFHIHTVLQGRGSEGVTEIMKSEVLQPGVLENLLVEIHHRVRVVHLSGEG